MPVTGRLWRNFSIELWQDARVAFVHSRAEHRDRRVVVKRTVGAPGLSVAPQIGGVQMTVGAPGLSVAPQIGGVQMNPLAHGRVAVDDSYIGTYIV